VRGDIFSRSACIYCRENGSDLFKKTVGNMEVNTGEK
jgi:hypothetical protein